MAVELSSVYDSSIISHQNAGDVKTVSRATDVDCCNYMQPKIIHNKHLNLPLWLCYRMRGQGHQCHCEGRNQNQVEPPMPPCLTTQEQPLQVSLLTRL